MHRKLAGQNYRFARFRRHVPSVLKDRPAV
jgi:hypothetical protein